MKPDRLMRRAILAAAGNGSVRRAVSRYGMQMGAKRFVAGESAEEFLRVARTVNGRGFAVAGTLLGESVAEPSSATAAADEYCALLRTFAADRYDANVAFKLTHVGLEIDPELALRNAGRIAQAASDTENSVRIDMEQSSLVDDTLRIYRRLRKRWACVGFVLQSYLFRSRSDLETLLPLRPNVRIVKGAYLEPSSVAFANKRDVDENYVALVQAALSNDGYTAIATHDPAIVQRVEEIVEAKRLPKRGRFEFQMLYGISTPLARRLLERGYRVRLSLPYGADWFPYLMRRLAERPANLAFFLKGAMQRE